MPASAPHSSLASPQKPPNLVYGLQDRPPLPLTLLFGLQQVCMMAVGVFFPVIIARACGATPEVTKAMVSLTMIAGGLGTILQSLRKGPIGSGYLCPEAPDPSFLSVSLLAGTTRGLHLVFGMTLVAGVFEMVLSRVLYRLRSLFPAEVVGVVVAMVGISLIPVAIPHFAGIRGEDTVTTGVELVVGCVTLGTIMAVNVWGKGTVRQFSLLIGMIVGYAVAGALGLVTAEHIRQLREARLLSFPSLGHVGWSFEPALLAPFAVATICSTLKNVGDVTTCQRINDVNWARPDMRTIRGGIVADGAASILGGLLGGMGQASYSACVGLSIATSATSRVIAYAAGGLFIILAFCPKLAAAFAIVPSPVFGAALMFAVCFMIMAGLQIMLSRMIDARKTLVIGLSLILGLSVSMAPQVFQRVPAWLAPLVSSPLSVATISVVLLNWIFSLGLAKHAAIQLAPGPASLQQITDFMETQGGAWAARRDVVQRAVVALNEFVESAMLWKLAQGSIRVEASFDEFNLDVSCEYDGELIEFSEVRPRPEELVEDERALERLSGYLVRHQVDRIKTERKDGRCKVQFHFDH